MKFSNPFISYHERTTTCSKSFSESDCVMRVEGARAVKYKQRNGIPSLENWRGCTNSRVSWVPVFPSAVAY